MSNLRLCYLQKVGGGGDICTGHPPTQRSGGGGGYIPPSPGIYASGRMSKLGAKAKSKSCKIYRTLWEMRAMSCFVLSFCERMHSYPLRPGPFIVPKASETKHHTERQIVMHFWNIYFLTLRLI